MPRFSSSTGYVDIEDCTSSEEHLFVKEYTSGPNKRAIIAVVACVSILTLVLGLGLGLGLKSSSSTEEGCFTKHQHKDFLSQWRREQARNANKKTWDRDGCPAEGQLNCPAGVEKPLTVIISLDGFRADYLLRNLTPNLQHLIECGAHAKYMRSVYPSKTFPNHYSLMTGLYPESHGIIANTMYDPDMKVIFNKRVLSVATDPRWFHGEPLWNTVQKADRSAATFNWFSSDVEIQEMRPDICYVYNSSWSLEERMAEVLGTLNSQLNEELSDFISIYLEQPDQAGHIVGPFGEWVNNNLTRVDSLIGELLDYIATRDLQSCVNVIVVADHGMEEISCDKVVDLKPYLDIEQYTFYEGVQGTITSEYTVDSDGKVTEKVGEDPLKTLEYLKCEHFNNTNDWKLEPRLKQDQPVRRHYAANKRIDPIVVDAADKWVFTKNKATLDNWNCEGGAHGYDALLQSMHALFIASGPSFKQNFMTESFNNIEVFNLLADIMGIEPPENNGTRGALNHLLIKPNRHPDSPEKQAEYTVCKFPEDEDVRKRRREMSDCECSEQEGNEDALDLAMHASRSPAEEHLPHGIPLLAMEDASVCLLTHEAYAAGFSHSHQQPLWSAFTLTAASVTDSEIDIDATCVRPDVRLDDQVNCTDYVNEEDGIVAVHLFPPTFTANQSDAEISTNLVPMYNTFKNGVWQTALELIQEYAMNYNSIQVIVGPLFDWDANGLADADLSKTVSSGSSVPIPSHFFISATMCSDPDITNCSQPEIMTAILPHRPYMHNCMEMRLHDYIIDHCARLADLEPMAGLHFLPNLLPSNRVQAMTFLPEKLWERPGWFDAFQADGECPPMDAANCPPGFDPAHPPLLLISLDGFRPDYLERGLTPYMSALSECGTSASHMRSIYPTITFPNHYSIITGLYPEAHGIIDNSMYDNVLNETFSYGGSPAWWGGEPVWNLVEWANKSSMCMLWAGSDEEINGTRPTAYYDYDSDIPYNFRVDEILRWLDGSEDGRLPDFLTLYFSDVDSVGHEHGKDSLQMDESLVNIDEIIHRLMDGLYRRDMHQCVNIIVVSDHGMSDISCDRSVQVGDHLNEEQMDKICMVTGPAPRISTQYTCHSWGEYLHLAPHEQVPVGDLVEELECTNEHIAFYAKEDMPTRHHFVQSNRINDVLVKPVDLWVANYDEPWCGIIGNHGWDPKYESMNALFMAYGPGFHTSKVVRPFENIELYNMMCELVGVTPGRNNGTDGSLHHLLRAPPPLPESDASEDQSTCAFPETDDEYDRRANASECWCHIEEGTTVKDYDAQLDLDEDEQSDLETLHLPHGIPKHHEEQALCLLRHTDYVSGYSHHLKMPLWTAATLTVKNSIGSSITDCLRPDVRLEPEEQFSCEDFEFEETEFQQVFLFPTEWGSSANSSMDMALLSNSLALSAGMVDNGVWSKLLNLSHEWAVKYEEIHVMFGPVFDFNADGLRDENITNTVGDADIPLPSHLFAIFLKCPSTDCSDMDYDVQAFVVPNKPNPGNCLSHIDAIAESYTRIRDIELLTGLEFLTANHTQTAFERRTHTPAMQWET